jgi:endonuclease YncB( thermonuclease family)
MLRICSVLAFSFLTVAARPERPWVIDGDTVVWHGKHIRIENLDAPEIGEHSRCALELQRGQAAKRFAIRLVQTGRTFELYGFDHIDRFGRTVARLKIDGRDFGELMMAAGVARPWRGRTSDWCD